MGWFSKTFGFSSQSFADKFVPEKLKGSFGSKFDKLVPEKLKGSLNVKLDIDDFLPESLKNLGGSGGGADEAPTTPAVPEPPTIEKPKETAQAKADAKRKAIRRSRSIYTSPLGVSQQAKTISHFLTGQ